MAATIKSLKKNNFQNGIIVFARYPKPGRVKTRLAEKTSDEFACSVYKISAENIFREISSLKNFNKYIFCTNEKNKIIAWTKNKFFYFIQQGNDLGERMINAFDLVLRQNNHKAVIIGTDIPDLSKEIILEAFDALDENDIVVGPAYDGGYYLLGMKKVYQSLFININWSSELVFNSTLNKVSSLNLKVKKLKLLHDIDTKEILDEWMVKTNNEKLKRKYLKLLEL